ncbi:germ cell nuclear acidic protein [Rhinoraja longicauda]
MDEMCNLFQRLANQLGWPEYNDLDDLETEVQQKIEKSKKQCDYCEDVAVNLPSETGESPSTNDSCVCKLILSSSEDEADSSSKVSLDDVQKERGKCNAAKNRAGKLQIHRGSEVASDSSDEIFEISLTHEKTLNSDFKSRGASRIHNKRFVNAPVVSSDSSGDDDFEKFVTLMKKSCSSTQKYRISNNDDSLKDFIASDSSLDEVDIKEIVEPEHSADTELHEPTRQSLESANESTMEQVYSTSSVTRSMSPVSNNSVTDFVIETKQRSLTVDKWRKESEQSNPHACDREPRRLDDNSLSYSVHSKVLNNISNTSDTSSDEFESLINRVKSISQRTPAATSRNLKGKRMAVTEPVKQKTKSKIQGIKHLPEDECFVPVFIQPTKPKKDILSDSTSVKQLPAFNTSSYSESQSQRLCKVPGCFLQDLILSSSKYVKNFKQNREQLTQELYNLYNKTIFQQKLPEKLEIKWNKKMTKTAGYCITGLKKDESLLRYARIELSEKVCDSAERLRDTLIHELCHAATWLINNIRDGHGTIWKHYAHKSELIHPELPMVQRCHTYQINYKYTYQCSRCKNMIGRHSKSLDTQRFVCGICKGSMELLSNSKYTTPAKRELAPFAKFVKENYSSTKKENEGLKHAEVMRKLSVDFGKKAQISDL